MIKVVALDEYLVDRIVDLVRDYRGNVESGGVSGFGQSVADELSDMDAILSGLQNAEDDEREVRRAFNRANHPSRTGSVAVSAANLERFGRPKQ